MLEPEPVLIFHPEEILQIVPDYRVQAQPFVLAEGDYGGITHAGSFPSRSFLTLSRPRNVSSQSWARVILYRFCTPPDLRKLFFYHRIKALVFDRVKRQISFMSDRSEWRKSGVFY